MRADARGRKPHVTLSSDEGSFQVFEVGRPSLYNGALGSDGTEVAGEVFLGMMVGKGGSGPNWIGIPTLSLLNCWSS